MRYRSFATLLAMLAPVGCAGRTEGQGAPDGGTDAVVDAQPDAACQVDHDCPAVGAPCKLCSDGKSTSCPLDRCVRGQCVLSWTTCPGEDGGPGCGTSNECVAPAICQACADGSSSCARGECVHGVCQVIYPPCPAVDGGATDAGADCAALGDDVNQKLAAAKACCATCHSLQCTASVDGICCPVTVETASAQATLDYLAALAAFRTAGCVVNCPAIACETGPSYNCQADPSGTGSCR